MLALGAEAIPADGANYGFEYKWDGVRAIAYWDGRTLTFSSRNRLDMTAQYPELQALGAALGPGRRVVLDGEVVALDDLDRPSFPRLQKRMKVRDPATARRLSREIPAYFFVFDLLHLDGRSTTRLPLTDRRALLEELTLQGPNWQVSPSHVDQGATMLEAARANMLEGIVAKRLDSVYAPGARTSDWLKIKLVLRQEFVIGGWTNEKGMDGGLGALQLGYYDAAGKLRYAGSVGSGFTHATVRSLLKLLSDRVVAKSPFADKLPRRDVHWAQPTLVAEVEFRRWPEGGMLQQAAYKGLRFDKDPRAVVKETFGCMADRRSDEAT
jgi:bifunctional non-homologous end joining protein LigD